MTRINSAVRTGVVATVLLAAGVAAALTGATGADANGDDRTADTVAIQATQACYGRAQDVVYRNYANAAKAKREGHAAFAACFTEDAHISIGLLGAAPFERADSIGGWVDFVRQFGLDHGYLSARHLIGNVEVVYTSRDTATVYSAGTTPHFVGAGTSTPGIDWIIGNYRGQVKRIHGQWLITEFQINADEFAHTAAQYPNGRSDGSGNIGFPDNIDPTH
jgi:hypothetical protein